MDPISAIIRKERLLSFPAGQAFNGVIFEIQRDPDLTVSIL
jgi:hypothetical protein